MPAIPNSLNSGGRRRYPGSTAGLGLDDQNMLLRPGAAPAGLPMLGGTGGTSLAVGPAAAFGRPPMMFPMLGGSQHSSGMAMPSFGGGGFPENGGGGGTPEFGGFKHQAPFESRRDGSTVAPVNPGAAPYHGLSAFDAQFNGEHARPHLTSWGQDWREAEKPLPPQKLPPSELVRGFADGTDGHPAPPGVPVIVGDPQKDGKPNPELVLQTPQGLHIIPLKDMPEHMRGRVDGREIPTKPAPVPMTGLKKFYSDNPDTPTAAQVHMMNMMRHPEMPTYFPSAPLVHAAYGNEKPKKYAEGTGTLDPSRFNLTDEYVPGFVPRLDTGGAFGRTLPFSDGSGGIEARDVNNNVVGFSTGLTPLPPAPVPHGTNAPPSLPSLETPEQYHARRLAMNPQQIDVGFTPRPALHGFADADALRSGGASRADHEYARMERDLFRQAKGSPYIEHLLLSGKAQAASDALKRQDELQKHQDQVTHWDSENRRKSNAAAGYADIGAGVGQPMAKTVGAQRLEAEQARNAIVDQREAERLGISKEQLAIQKDNARRAEEEVQRKLHPQPRLVPVEGTDRAVEMNYGQRIPSTPEYQQAAPAGPSTGLPWLGSQAGPMGAALGGIRFPGSPPQFKPLAPPVKNPDPTGVKAVKDHLDAISKTQSLLAGINKALLDHPDDATLKASKTQYETWLKHHSNAYEQGLGIEPPPPVGMGDVHAAEGAMPAPTGADAISALTKRTLGK